MSQYIITTLCQKMFTNNILKSNSHSYKKVKRETIFECANSDAYSQKRRATKEDVILRWITVWLVYSGLAKIKTKNIYVVYASLFARSNINSQKLN